MTTAQFLSIEGYQVVVTYHECGCYHETRYDPITAEAILIKLEICGECFDSAAALLDQRTMARKAQLTLPLPSAEGDRGRDETD